MIGHPLNRTVAQPPHDVRRYSASFQLKGAEEETHRVVAKVSGIRASLIRALDSSLPVGHDRLNASATASAGVVDDFRSIDTVTLWTGDPMACGAVGRHAADDKPVSILGRVHPAAQFGATGTSSMSRGAAL
jgi:hypothetical protein